MAGAATLTVDAVDASAGEVGEEGFGCRPRGQLDAEAAVCVGSLDVDQPAGQVDDVAGAERPGVCTEVAAKGRTFGPSRCQSGDAGGSG